MPAEPSVASLVSSSRGLRRGAVKVDTAGLGSMDASPHGGYSAGGHGPGWGWKHEPILAPPPSGRVGRPGPAMGAPVAGPRARRRSGPGRHLGQLLPRRGLRSAAGLGAPSPPPPAGGARRRAVP